MRLAVGRLRLTLLRNVSALAFAVAPASLPMLQGDPGAIGELRLIDVARLDGEPVADAPALPDFSDTVVDATLVGGLSGIDYDPETGAWVAISDDPSENAPARYYTVDLTYGLDGIDTFEFTGSVTLLQANGEPYPNAIEGGNVPDLEAIRFDPRSDGIWYTSEGSHELGVDPFVGAANPNGSSISTWTPTILTVSEGEDRGPRENLAFEGLTFAADGESLWVAMEGPLFQDGKPSSFDTSSYARLTRTDRDGNLVRQVAYEIDRIPAVGAPVMATTAGVSEILAVTDESLLVLERASVENEASIDYFVAIHEVQLAGATDIGNIDALADASFVPVSKRLVLDLNSVGVEPLGNVEGMTWGPNLDNGNRSIVLIVDDNFAVAEATAVIVLEVLP